MSLTQENDSRNLEKSLVDNQLAQYADSSLVLDLSRFDLMLAENSDPQCDQDSSDSDSNDDLEVKGKGNHPEKKRVMAEEIEMSGETAPVHQLPRQIVPQEMPRLALVEGGARNYLQKVPSEVTWKQDRSHRIVLKFHLTHLKVEDVNANSCNLEVEDRKIRFQYHEIYLDEQGHETSVLHKIPDLQLFSEVEPEVTEVRFAGKVITVYLQKIRQIFWRHFALDPDTGKLSENEASSVFTFWIVIFFFIL